MKKKVAVVEKTKVIERDDNKPVVTIVLGNSNPTELKSYHCSSCGRIVFNYYSEIRIVITGEMREVSRPIDIFCSRCSLVHRVV